MKKSKNNFIIYQNFFLFGSRIEYDPLVMYEAIVSNVKFISYNVGSCKRIIKKDTGFISNNDNTKIEYIMKNFKKNKKKNKNVKKFYWNIICKKYYNIFNS
jgi:glycosyltransferase involved in cell wall biosynthesis